MSQHNAQGNPILGLSCTFSVGKQRTSLLDDQPTTSGNCIYFIYEANWSSTAQLHSDPELNSKHHKTQCLPIQLFAFYKGSSSLSDIDLAELPCNWSFDSLLSCDQSLVQNTHAHMHACIQIPCRKFKCSRDQHIPELVFYPFLFQLFWMCALWEIFFNYNYRLHWPLPHSGPEICDAQLMSSYWMLHFFPLHLVSFILQKPNPFPRAILFISSWAAKWALQVITSRSNSLYSHQRVCSHTRGEELWKLEGSNLSFHVSVSSNRCLEHVFKVYHGGKYCDHWQIFSKSNFPSITEPTLQRTGIISVTSCDKSTYLPFLTHAEFITLCIRSLTGAKILLIHYY